MNRAILAATLAALSSPAMADLQGACPLGPVTPCVSNGEYTPINLSQLSRGFSFIDPAQPDPDRTIFSSLELVFLVPTTQPALTSFAFTSFYEGAQTAAFAGTWTLGSGQVLSQFLGLDMSPSNSFNSFQVGADTDVTSFNVFMASGLQTAPGCECRPPVYSFTANASVTMVAFGSLLTDGIEATSPGGQLQVQPFVVPAPTLGAGLPGLVFAIGGLLTWWRRRGLS